MKGSPPDMKKIVFFTVLFFASVCFLLCGCDNNSNNKITVDIDKAVQEFEHDINVAEKDIAKQK